jgi:hypothetical protein
MKANDYASVIADVDLHVPLMLSDLVDFDPLVWICIKYLCHQVTAPIADKGRYLIVGIEDLFI